MKKLLPNHQTGFSLVEPLLVVVIVGFIILTINNLPGAFNLIGDSHFQSTAKDVASQEIENERATGYVNLANGGPTNFSDPRLSSLPSGSATVTISDCSNPICTNGEQIKQVVVNVGWTEKGQNKSYQLSTLISNGGLK